MTKQFRDLLTTVDVMNTLHGGVSEPFLSIREVEDGRVIRIRVPGIQKDLLKAEINKNNISVFYLIPISSDGKLVHLPVVIYNLLIPNFIDVDGIKTDYEENVLVIQLPFNKKIQID